MVDIAASIAGLLSAGFPEGADPSGQPRAALVFTSALRLGGSDRSFVDASNFFKSAAFMERIIMAVNPNSIRFRQPKRFVKKDTREGSVFFHFTNSKGQNNDILTMSFNGSTGNIDLRDAFTDAPRTEQSTAALQKMLVWHNLYALTREPMVLSDGTENFFVISYASPLFPLTVDFFGFFNQVLEFEENARKPNSRDYSFEFTVTQTDPPLDEVLSIIENFLRTPSATFSEQVPVVTNFESDGTVKVQLVGEGAAPVPTETPTQ